MISHTRTNPHPTCQFHELRFVKVGHDLRSHNRGCIGQLSTLIESAFCFSITIPTNHVIQQILKENTHSHKSIVSLTSFRSLALQKPTPKNRGWVLELLVGNGDRKRWKSPWKKSLRVSEVWWSFMSVTSLIFSPHSMIGFVIPIATLNWVLKEGNVRWFSMAVKNSTTSWHNRYINTLTTWMDIEYINIGPIEPIDSKLIQT